VPNLLTKNKHSGAGSISAADYGNKAAAEGDAEVRNQWQRAVLNGELSGKTVCGIDMLKKSLDADYETRGAISQDNGVRNLTEVNAMGIGLDYSHHMGLTSNYSGSADYDIIVKSGVASGDAVLPTARRDVAELQQTYVKNVAAFNSQTLVKTI
jgi:hypothetical protein